MLREQAGMNQTQLGSKFGMTQRKLSYIECGKYERGWKISGFCAGILVFLQIIFGIEQ